jgi:hypothetical protein
MTNADAMTTVHEKLNVKLNEYLTLLSPLERAENDILMAHRMLKARTEEEINHISPALGALSEELRVSSVDILLADDPRVFVREALEESGLTEEELRVRLISASSTAPEELRLLGFGE